MSSFRIMDTKFRILKGGKIGLAMSIAMIGGMLTLGSTNASAADVSLLSSSGDIFYQNTVTYYNNGLLVSGNGIVNSLTTGGLSTAFRESTQQNSIYGALGTLNGYSSSDNYNLASGVTILDQTKGTNASLSTSSALSVYNEQMWTVNVNGGSSYTVNPFIDEAWGLTYKGSQEFNWTSNVYSNDYYYYASGGSIFTARDSVGSYDELFHVTFDHYATSATYNSGIASSSAGYAINTTGTVTLNGNNTIDGSATATTFDVSGDNNDFNGAVSANNIYLNGDDNNFASTVNATGFINIGGNNNTFAGNVTTSAIQYGVAGSVAFTNGADLTGNVSFGGNDGIFTLGHDSNISGNIDTTSSRTGTLVFNGTSTITGSVGSTAAIKEIQVNSTGIDVITGATKANYVNLNAAGTIAFGGGLDTRLADSALSTVDFNNYDGTVQIGNNGSLYGNVVTDTNNNGTLTMISGTQVITGQIGTSADKIKTLNIGGTGIGGGLDTNASVYSVTTANGDIYAQNTVLNNNGTTNGSELRMASEYDLYSKVTTADANTGTLKLLGGNQIVTGDVGTTGTRLAQVDSGADGAISNFGTSLALAQTDVFAVTVQNTGTGTTNFSRDVGATTINVASGISNFTDDVTATTTNIGSGVANFNTNGTGTTSSNIVFSANTAATTSSTGSYTTSVLGSATANLINGLTGAISFAGNDATVNVWDGKAISSTIETATNSNTGTVNYRGDGTISSTVGYTGMGIKELNINTNNEQNTLAGVTASGGIYAGIVNLKNDGILTLSDGVDITGTTTSETNVISLTGTTQVLAAALNGSNANTGTIKVLGTSVITGVVGSNDAAIKTIEAGTDSKTVTFNNMVYAKNLNYTGNGTVILNGQAGLDANTAGMKGTVDFGTNVTNTGTLQIGDNVNLTTGTAGIQFADANGATLTFNGSSVVNGNVGSLSGTDTFKVINAGVATETVTFNDNVYFMDSLKLSNDGIIEIADGKYAKRNSISATTGAIVTTTTDGLGNLKYKGSTTLYGDIGTASAMLKSVTFNSASNNVTQNIGHNVYADTVTIGGVSGTTGISLVGVNGVYDYAGATIITEYRGGTVANITADVTLGGDLFIANDTSAINFGTSHVTVGMNHNGTTPGVFTTNNGAMSFTVNTKDITSGNQAASTSSGSGQVTTAALNMSGSEKIHINYVGSLANNGTYTLISDTGTTGTGTYSHVEGDGKVTDNSFAIDTTVSRSATDNLILTAHRDESTYVQKSDTKGHFSNNAAIALAGISADGSQTGDMIEVIQKLELDSYGYGNNQENLAVQVQKLAPIVNTSFAQTSIGATKLVTDTVGSRLSDVRGLSSGDEVKDRGAWAKVIGSTASQDKVGQFDGYSLSSGGVVFGIDKELRNNAIIGLAAGYTNTKTDQDDFRDGDKSTTDSYQLSLYGSKTFDKAYVDGSLSYTKHNTDGTRSTAIDRVASYDVDANQLSAKVNGGYNFAFENKVTLTPFASLEYSNIKQGSYKEEGAGAISLSVDDVTVNRGGAGLGVKVSKEIKTENKMVYVPEFKLGANKYFGDDNVEVAAQFEQGNKFITKGAEMTDLMYNAGLGLKTKFTEATSVSLTTDYERSNDGDFQGVNGQLTFRMQF